MKRFLLALALLLIPSTGWAQCNGVFANNTVCGNNTGTSNTPRAVSPASLLGAAGGTNGQVQVNNAGALGGLTNTQLTADINTFTPTLPGTVPAGGGASSFKTSNYTIANTDCGTTVQYGTGVTGSITATLPSTTGFPVGCTVIVKNGDTVRGKFLSGFPSDLNAILYPLQSATVQVINSAWVTVRNPGRWAIPSSISFFVDTAGSNTANDGLATGASGAFATLQKCVTTIQQAVDTGPFNPICKMADGTYATGATDGGGGALINGPLVGSGFLNITGNSVTPTNVVIDGAASPYCIQAQNYAQVTVSYVQCKNAALLFAAPINSAWMQLCGVDVGSTTAGGIQLYSSRQSYMEVICGPITNSGTTAGYGIQVSHQGNFRATALLTGNTLMTYNQNITFSVTNVYAASGGDFTLTQYPSAAATPWNANGKTITGQKWQIDSGGIIQSLGISGACSQEPLGTAGGFILGTGSYSQACHQTPVITSCGTSPATAGNDYFGSVLEGTTSTGCTITFQSAFTAIPFCTISYQTATPGTLTFTRSTTALVISHASVSNPQFQYNCTGF